MDLKVLILTIQIALVATLINLPFAIVVSWVLVKRKIRGKIILDALVSLPLAVPPVVIGFLLLILLGTEGPIGAVVHYLFQRDLVFTWVAAAIASAVVSFPLVTRTFMVAINAVDERLEMTARSLGASPFKVALTITIPLAYRGILAGVLLGFVRALSEFGATITVAGNIPGKTQTLPLAIYSKVLIRDDLVAAQLVVISIALAVVTLILHNILLYRYQREKGMT